MKYLLLVFFAAISFSCVPVMKEVYGVNKKIEFKNRKEYISHLQNKYNFNLKNLYYADEKSYDNLINHIVTNDLNYFYGIVLNDSIQIKRSGLIKNESCSYSILNEMNAVPKELNSTNTEKNNFFVKNSFFNILNDEPLNLNSNERKKIILIFSYTMGQLRESDFVEIEKLFIENRKFDLYILTVDRVFDLDRFEGKKTKL
ncbi:hypothetical protein [Chryseobacterium schmidteae]|uniref:hypothetical protein n=1 Tax=Chryseobacterium schmidteae TaxID=2730404 RepID=UPI00158E746A|nr:hypothetical protein [Chryseobacterium schmidteae]